MKKILLLCELFNEGGSGKLSSQLFHILNDSKRYDLRAIHIYGNNKDENIINYHKSKVKYILIKVFFRFLRLIFSRNQHYFFNKIFFNNFSIFKTKEIKKKLKNFKPDILIITGFEYCLSFKEVLKLKKLFNSKIIIYPIDHFVFTGGCRYSLMCKNFKSNCLKCIGVINIVKKSVYNNLKNNVETILKISPKILLPSSTAKEYYKSSSFYNQTLIEPHLLLYPQTKPEITINETLKNKVYEKLNFNIESNSNKKIILIATQNFSEWRKGMFNLKYMLNVFIGRHAEVFEKNIFIIIGKKSEELFKFKLKNCFYVTKEINYNLLKDIYKIVDIIIVPSYQEWSSLILSEAIAFNKIVLAFDTGSSADLIENGKNGFTIKKYDVANFIDKLFILLNLSKDDLKQYKQNSKIIFEKKIASNVFLDKFDKLIK